jgi:hypothetical protein
VNGLPSGWAVTASIQRYCPHSRLAQRCDDPGSHPTRVMTTVLVRANQLTPIHKAHLQAWIETSAKLHHGHPEWMSPNSLESVLRFCPGEVRVSVQKHLRDLTGRDRGVVIRVRIAPWASGAILMAEFSALDCSLEGLQSCAYSVPRSVAAKVVIPREIGLAREAIYPAWLPKSSLNKRCSKSNWPPNIAER